MGGTATTPQLNSSPSWDLLASDLPEQLQLPAQNEAESPAPQSPQDLVQALALARQGASENVQHSLLTPSESSEAGGTLSPATELREQFDENLAAFQRNMHQDPELATEHFQILFETAQYLRGPGISSDRQVLTQDLIRLRRFFQTTMGFSTSQRFNGVALNDDLDPDSLQESLRGVEQGLNTLREFLRSNAQEVGNLSSARLAAQISLELGHYAGLTMDLRIWEGALSQLNLIDSRNEQVYLRNGVALLRAWTAVRHAHSQVEGDSEAPPIPLTDAQIETRQSQWAESILEILSGRGEISQESFQLFSARLHGAINEVDESFLSQLTLSGIDGYFTHLQYAEVLAAESTNAEAGTGLLRRLQAASLYGSLGQSERARELLIQAEGDLSQLPTQAERIEGLWQLAQLYQGAGLTEDTLRILSQVEAAAEASSDSEHHQLALRARALRQIQNGEITEAQETLSQIAEAPGVAELQESLEQGQRMQREARVYAVWQLALNGYLEQLRSEENPDVEEIEAELTAALAEAHGRVLRGECDNLDQAMGALESGRVHHYLYSDHTQTHQLRRLSNLNLSEAQFSQAVMDAAQGFLRAERYNTAAGLAHVLRDNEHVGSQARELIAELPDTMAWDSILTSLGNMSIIFAEDAGDAVIYAGITLATFGVAEFLAVEAEVAYGVWSLRSGLAATGRMGLDGAIRSGIYMGTSSAVLTSSELIQLGCEGHGEYITPGLVLRSFLANMVMFGLLRGTGSLMGRFSRPVQQRLAMAEEVAANARRTGVGVEMATQRLGRARTAARAMMLARWGSRVGALTATEYTNEGLGLRESSGSSLGMRLLHSAVIDAQMMIAARAVNAASGGRMERRRRDLHQRYAEHAVELAQPDIARILENLEVNGLIDTADPMALYLRSALEASVAQTGQTRVAEVLASSRGRRALFRAMDGLGVEPGSRAYDMAATSILMNALTQSSSRGGLLRHMRNQGERLHGQRELLQGLARQMAEAASGMEGREFSETELAALQDRMLGQLINRALVTEWSHGDLQEISAGMAEGRISLFVTLGYSTGEFLWDFRQSPVEIPSVEEAPTALAENNGGMAREGRAPSLPEASPPSEATPEVLRPQELEASVAPSPIAEIIPLKPSSANPNPIQPGAWARRAVAMVGLGVGMEALFHPSQALAAVDNIRSVSEGFDPHMSSGTLIGMGLLGAGLLGSIFFPKGNREDSGQVDLNFSEAAPETPPSPYQEYLIQLGRGGLPRSHGAILDALANYGPMRTPDLSRRVSSNHPTGEVLSELGRLTDLGLISAGSDGSGGFELTSRGRELRQVMSHFGLHMVVSPQGRAILHVLSQRRYLTHRGLLRDLGESAGPELESELDFLERRGLLNIYRDPVDARRTRYRLTQEGQDTAYHLRRQLSALENLIDQSNELIKSTDGGNPPSSGFSGGSQVLSALAAISSGAGVLLSTGVAQAATDLFSYQSSGDWLPLVFGGTLSLGALAMAAGSKGGENPHPSEALTEALEIQERLWTWDPDRGGAAVRDLMGIILFLEPQERLELVYQFDRQFGGDANPWGPLPQSVIDGMNHLLPFLEPGEQMEMARRTQQRLWNEDMRIQNVALQILELIIPQLNFAQRTELARSIQQQFRNKTPYIRARAVSALGQIIPYLESAERSQLARSIERQIEDEDPLVRHAAVGAISGLEIAQPTELARRIEQCLRGEDLNVRLAAVSALSRIIPQLELGERAALALTIVMREGESEWYRQALIRAWGNIIPHLEPQERLELAYRIEARLRDQDNNVRNLARDTLGEIIPALEPGHRMDLARRIEQGNREGRDSSDGFSVLEKIFPHLDQNRRLKLVLEIEAHLTNGANRYVRGALEAFATFIPLLEPEERMKFALWIESKLTDEDYDVRDSASEVLGRISPFLEPSERLQLAQRVEGRLRSENVDHRSNAIFDLGRIIPSLEPEDRLEPTLLIEAQLQEEPVQLTALSVLIRILPYLGPTEQLDRILRIDEKIEEIIDNSDDPAAYVAEFFEDENISRPNIERLLIQLIPQFERRDSLALGLRFLERLQEPPVHSYYKRSIRNLIPVFPISSRLDLLRHGLRTSGLEAFPIATFTPLMDSLSERTWSDFVAAENNSDLNILSQYWTAGLPTDLPDLWQDFISAPNRENFIQELEEQSRPYRYGQEIHPADSQALRLAYVGLDRPSTRQDNFGNPPLSWNHFHRTLTGTAKPLPPPFLSESFSFQLHRQIPVHTQIDKGILHQEIDRIRQAADLSQTRRLVLSLATHSNRTVRRVMRGYLIEEHNFAPDVDLSREENQQAIISLTPEVASLFRVIRDLIPRLAARGNSGNGVLQEILDHFLLTLAYFRPGTEQIRQRFRNYQDLRSENQEIPSETLLETLDAMLLLYSDSLPELLQSFEPSLSPSRSLVRYRNLLAAQRDGIIHERGEAAEVEIIFSNSQADQFFGYIGEDCTKEYGEEIFREDFQVARIIVDGRLEGMIYINRASHDGKLALTLAIAPRERLDLNAGGLLSQIEAGFSRIAQDGGYDYILISRNRNEQGNRVDMMNAIEARDYPVITFSNGESNLFRAQEYYLLWERNRPSNAPPAENTPSPNGPSGSPILGALAAISTGAGVLLSTDVAQAATDALSGQGSGDWMPLLAGGALSLGALAMASSSNGSGDGSGSGPLGWIRQKWNELRQGASSEPSPVDPGQEAPEGRGGGGGPYRDLPGSHLGMQERIEAALGLAERISEGGPVNLQMIREGFPELGEEGQNAVLEAMIPHLRLQNRQTDVLYLFNYLQTHLSDSQKIRLGQSLIDSIQRWEVREYSIPVIRFLETLGSQNNSSRVMAEIQTQFEARTKIPWAEALHHAHLIQILPQFLHQVLRGGPTAQREGLRNLESMLPLVPSYVRGPVIYDIFQWGMGPNHSDVILEPWARFRHRFYEDYTQVEHPIENAVLINIFDGPYKIFFMTEGSASGRWDPLLAWPHAGPGANESSGPSTLRDSGNAPEGTDASSEDSAGTAPTPPPPPGGVFPLSGGIAQLYPFAMQDHPNLAQAQTVLATSLTSLPPRIMIFGDDTPPIVDPPILSLRFAHGMIRNGYGAWQSELRILASDAEALGLVVQDAQGHYQLTENPWFLIYDHQNPRPPENGGGSASGNSGLFAGLMAFAGGGSSLFLPEVAQAATEGALATGSDGGILAMVGAVLGVGALAMARSPYREPAQPTQPSQIKEQIHRIAEALPEIQSIRDLTPNGVRQLLHRFIHGRVPTGSREGETQPISEALRQLHEAIRHFQGSPEEIAAISEGFREIAFPILMIPMESPEVSALESTADTAETVPPPGREAQERGPLTDFYPLENQRRVRDILDQVARDPAWSRHMRDLPIQEIHSAILGALNSYPILNLEQLGETLMTLARLRDRFPEGHPERVHVERMIQEMQGIAEEWGVNDPRTNALGVLSGLSAGGLVTALAGGMSPLAGVLMALGLPLSSTMSANGAILTRNIMRYGWAAALNDLYEQLLPFRYPHHWINLPRHLLQGTWLLMDELHESLAERLPDTQAVRLLGRILSLRHFLLPRLGREEPLEEESFSISAEELFQWEGETVPRESPEATQTPLQVRVDPDLGDPLEEVVEEEFEMDLSDLQASEREIEE